VQYVNGLRFLILKVLSHRLRHGAARHVRDGAAPPPFSHIYCIAPRHRTVRDVASRAESGVKEPLAGKTRPSLSSPGFSAPIDNGEQQPPDT